MDVLNDLIVLLLHPGTDGPAVRTICLTVLVHSLAHVLPIKNAVAMGYQNPFYINIESLQGFKHGHSVEISTCSI